ncbi:substrate-binding periplasmic protein [Marinomonas ostreistagni]|uniref:substrate-binding periplasmic protein n=1 Tax=Marinomonas ostreistagni TaxID=359209 RepID=UPI0019527032|nr:transporter substrate-binding domain-containing protein [Marinomonas ostreistagni]MBM6551627.1 transporter substrate-binding domain-containing protein [Marinomonas ostreistagni]
MLTRCFCHSIVRRFKPFACFALLVLSSVQAAQAEEEVQQCKLLTATGNPEYPPFLWGKDESGHLHGAVVKLLDQLSKRIGIKIETVYVGPWSRAQQEIRSGRADLMAGAFYTSGRADYMSYFATPMMYTKSSVWQAHDATFEYHSWEDLKGRWGVTVINNSFGQTFDNYAKQNLNILSVASVEQAFSMLAAGRADYVLYERSPGIAYVDHLGLNDKVVAVDPAISSEGLFLALSKKSPCNNQILKQQINDALRDLVQEGVPKAVLLESFTNWSRQ